VKCITPGKEKFHLLTSSIDLCETTANDHSDVEKVRTMVEAKVARAESRCNRQGYNTIEFIVLAAFAPASIHFYSEVAWNAEAEAAHREPKTSASAETTGCLSLDFDGDMDNLLSKYKQVFIEMPAKAAGTTFKAFTIACMASTNTTSFASFDNVLNRKENADKSFKQQLQMPSLIASHVYRNPQPIYDTMAHATEETLIVYSYREETSRLISAIKQVLSTICKRAETESGAVSGAVWIAPGECQVQEWKLLESIRKKQGEIGLGITQHLTCKTYEVIKDNNPNLVFVHYRKASQLQKLLAKHHCPVVTSEVRVNTAAAKEKNTNISIVLEGRSNNGTLVSLNDWLDAKRQLLALNFDLRKDASCQATTKDIQYELLRCPDETLQISGRSYEGHKIQFPSRP